MQTQTHFLMTAALAAPLRKRGLEIPTWPFLLGSFLPDVPLFVLSLWFGLFSTAAQEGMTAASMAEYDRLFFTDPLWIVPHNFFHAPLILTALFGLGLLLERRKSPWGDRLLWFALAAGLHTAIDILTHHNDGPLLFFPFDFHTRFTSPVSYWDPDHYGDSFTVFEIALNVALIGYFFLNWQRKRKALPTLTQ